MLREQEKDDDKEALRQSLQTSNLDVGSTNYNRKAQQKESEGEEDPNDPTISNKVFAGGVSWSTTEDGLKSYFSKFGEVEGVDIMRNPVDNQPRGFAFISFKDGKGVKKACELHMHQIDGKQVEVKPAFKRHEERDTGVLPTKLFIGGITADTKEKDLENYFSKYGHITAAVVMVDANTGRSRGFGFVTYENREDADKVLVHNDHVVKGKLVDVKTYKTRPDRTRPTGPTGMPRGGPMNMGMMAPMGYGGGAYGGYAGGMYGQMGYGGGGYGGYGGGFAGYGGYGGGGYQSYGAPNYGNMAGTAPTQNMNTQPGVAYGGYEDPYGYASFPPTVVDDNRGGNKYSAPIDPAVTSQGTKPSSGSFPSHAGSGAHNSQRQSQRDSRYKPY